MTIEKKDPKNIKPELVKIVKSKTGFDQKMNQLAFLITENQSQTKSILKQSSKVRHMLINYLIN